VPTWFVVLQIMNRVLGVTSTPHHARTEEKALDFHEQFRIFILRLDFLDACRHRIS
jgi:hypothetical protein